MSKFDVITIGDCTVDTFLVINEASIEQDLTHNDLKLCMEYGDKIPIKDSCQSVGGNAANVALGLKEQGFSTAIVSELGDDINGHVIKRNLKTKGVAQDYIKLLEEKETRYAMIIQYKSDRTVLSYYVDREYSLPNLAETDLIYYTSLGENFENLQNALIDYLEKNNQTKLALNPGSYQIRHLAKLEQIFSYVDYLFVNKTETERILNEEINSLKDGVDKMHKKGFEYVCITDGANGAIAANKERGYFQKPYPIEPVGKTGAGDAFASGFLGAQLSDKDLETSIKWATASAGGVIQHVDTNTGILNQKEIQEIISDHQDHQPKKV